MRPARVRRYDAHFADVNATARIAPPGAVHGGEYSGPFTIPGSFGGVLHGWQCVCGAGKRVDSAQAAQLAYDEHIAAVAK